MKNFYCSFLNSPEAFVLGNRLIYQDQPGKEPREAEPAKGAKKEGSGLWDFAKRGQKETQKKLDRLDFLAFQAKIDTVNDELHKLVEEQWRLWDQGIKIPKELVQRKEILYGKVRTIGDELIDRYKLGGTYVYGALNLNTDGEDILISKYGYKDGDGNPINAFTRIRPDGTFVEKIEKFPGTGHVVETITDTRKSGKFYELPPGKKAPDEF